jgi:iron complex outermembrane receptor protein
MQLFVIQKEGSFKTGNMKAFLIIFFLIFPFFVFAQDDKKNLGAVSGMISTADGQAVPYVSVLIKNTKQGTITDEKGNFEIKKIKPGTYIFSISLSGYTDSTINVEVKQNETSFLKIQLRGTYAELRTVIVAASLHSNYAETKISESLRLNLPLNEIPQNITVTSKQLIFDQGLLSISEAIRTASGVVKTYGGLNDYTLIIRGTDANWNVFRNGVGGYWWNQQEDASMLEKIEFIKGPAGFIVSIAEPGGIVNNITKQPVIERIANIHEGYGSYNMMRITADFGGPLNKKANLTYRFNAGTHNQERAFQFGKAYRYFVCAAVKYDYYSRIQLHACKNVW